MKKYKVTQEFMEELNKWRYERATQFDIVRLDQYALNGLPDIVKEWHDSAKNVVEENERLMAIFRLTVGEDMFEIGTPSYVVRLKDNIPLYGKGYIHIATNGYVDISYYMEGATKFDDFKKASEWDNKHFEVVELDE